MDLSIITINYKTPELLGDLLNSLNAVRETGELDFEVIVVNVTPGDGSEVMINKSYPWVKQIIDTRNRGFSGNNNIGLKEATGRYVLFLNSDTTVPKGTLSDMVRFMDSHSRSVSSPDRKGGRRTQNYVDPAHTGKERAGHQNKPIGAATCYVELASGGMDPDCHRGFPTPWASLTHFLGLENLFPQSRIFGQYHQFYKDLTETHEIDACAGAFLLMPRAVGEKIDLRDIAAGETSRVKSAKTPEVRECGDSRLFDGEGKKLSFKDRSQSLALRNSPPVTASSKSFGTCNLGCGTSGRGTRPVWWDEDFFFYGEDLDLCWRIREAGYKIMFYPHVKITHHKGGSSGIREESKDVTKASEETKKRILPETTRAMRLFYQKHFEEKYTWILNKAVFLGIKILETFRLQKS